MSTEPNRPLSAIELQELHRRLLAAREEGIDPDPADVAAAEQINSDPLSRFDRSWAPDEQ